VREAAEILERIGGIDVASDPAHEPVDPDESGQSPSVAIARKPRSRISRFVSAARR
jgi:hypothetical protein